MFEFKLPDVGEGVAEGEILAWYVDPGDRIDEDAVLAEVETDKAVVDLPSPKAGTVVELHAEVGEVVPVGDVLVTIDTGEDGADAAGAATDDDAGAASEDAEADDTQAEAGADAEAGGGEPAGTGGRVFAPPNVRRLARELGVEISAVDGSGPGGRVTEADVRAAAGAGGSDDETVKSAVERVDSEQADGEVPSGAATEKVAGTAGEDGEGADDGEAAAARTVTSDDQGEAADRERTLAAPATRKAAREAGIDIDEVPTDKTREGEAFVEVTDVRAYAQTAAAGAAGDGEVGAEGATGSPAGGTAGAATPAGEVTRKPYRGIRRTIGERMAESAYTAPHVTHHDTAVVDALVETRAKLEPRAADRGVDLTYLPFVMKAVVAGLREFPILNSTLDEDSEEIVLKDYYDIGVAVATDEGLLVPVVESVDEKGILTLAGEIEDLAARARERSLTPEEMRGGTFSITNFGAIGGEYATPIINYPETAILGLGRIEQRPVVEDAATEGAESGDPASTGEVVAAHTLPLSLSIDHRVIDGAEAARFVNSVKRYLEEPSLLLLE